MHFSGSYFSNPNHTKMPIHIFTVEILCITLYCILTDKIYFTMSFTHLLHAAEKAGVCD